eukprot:gnl/TRDRNA2_/TRDRNA2_170295_c0_seq2.p1 gnl/TRDRNA2_/TRDRNA2_170295_c0~~gnl/TRDRNA2_/TRDRNA2_170295_c0_seq2.p1  ORF type:complete len:180 (+),score=14.41 gnl/TRDRNA2_/TRDRNA2_170295_c0_seq2:52-591(+)
MLLTNHLMDRRIVVIFLAASLLVATLRLTEKEKERDREKLAFGDQARCPSFGEGNILPTLPVLQGPHFNESWDAYLGQVYGKLLLAEHYPVDLNRFEWFYSSAPIDVIPLTADIHCQVPFGGAWKGPCPHPEAIPNTVGFFVQRYPGVGATASSMGTVGPGTWVEVMHGIFVLEGVAYF